MRNNGIILLGFILICMVVCTSNTMGGDVSKNVKKIFEEYELEAWKIVIEEKGGEDCYSSLDDLDDVEGAIGGCELEELSTIEKTTINDYSFDESELNEIFDKLVNFCSKCETRINSIKKEWKEDLRLLCNNSVVSNKKAIENAIKVINSSDKNKIEDLSELDEKDDDYEDVSKLIVLAKLLKIGKDAPDEYLEIKSKIKKWNEEKKENKIDNKIYANFPWWSAKVVEKLKNYLEEGIDKEDKYWTNTPDSIQVMIKNAYENKTDFKKYNEIIKNLNKKFEASGGKREDRFETIAPNFTNWGLVGIISAIIAFLLIAVYMIIRLMKQENIEDIEVEEINSSGKEIPTEVQLAEIKKELELSATKISTLEKENKQLRAEIDRLKETNREDNYSQNPVPITLPQDQTQNQTQPPSTKTSFALSANGNFGFRTISLHTDAENDYLFILKTEGKTGKFYISDKPEMQLMAAKSANSVLRNICEYMNLPRDTQTGIKTMTPGKIQLNEAGDEWEVIEKVKIKFV